jgi:Protein of unknown function (DUF982)
MGIRHGTSSQLLWYFRTREIVGSYALRDAAEALMCDWPHDGGEEFCDAVRTCLDVMIGRIAPSELHGAMLRAAGEAGITAITVVH